MVHATVQRNVVVVLLLMQMMRGWCGGGMFRAARHDSDLVQLMAGRGATNGAGRHEACRRGRRSDGTLGFLAAAQREYQPFGRGHITGAAAGRHRWQQAAGS